MRLIPFSKVIFANAKHPLNAAASIVSTLAGISIEVIGQEMYLQPIITQYFIDNKSEIWLLFLIAHSKR